MFVDSYYLNFIFRYRYVLFSIFFILLSLFIIQHFYFKQNEKHHDINDIEISMNRNMKSQSVTPSLSIKYSLSNLDNSSPSLLYTKENNNISISKTISTNTNNIYNNYTLSLIEDDDILSLSSTPSRTISVTPSPTLSLTPSLSSSSSILNNIKNSSKCLKVITYNVREGVQVEILRNLLISYLQNNNFDIIALQELNNWTSNDLENTAKLWGHNYTVFLQTKTGYHLGITSLLPFEIIRLRTDGFWHGMIHIRLLPSSKTMPDNLLQNYTFIPDSFNDFTDDDEINDLSDISTDNDFSLHLLVTHLDPHNTTARFQEVHHIDHQVREHSRLLLFGDLNALSLYDIEYYNSIDLLSILQSDITLTNKFLYHPLNTSKEYEIDYRIMEKLYTDGEFQDLEYYFRNEFIRSVPTESNNDFTHAAPMRLDYILASLSIYDNCISSYIDITEETSLISDHFPVISEFCF